MTKNRNSLTVIQLNDSHAYFEQLQPGRHYPTAFVTEQGVAGKYGRNRQHHTERSIEALRAYLARHSPLRAELRGTFVAV